MPLQHGQLDRTADGSATSDEALIAAALMRTRDALVGTETVSPQPGQGSGLDAGERLRRMGAEFRRAALIAELLEDIAYEIEEDGPTARAITVMRRSAGSGTAADYVPLACAIRPEVADFSNAAPLVAAYAELRSDRLAEILAQTRHLIPFASAILPVTPGRTPAVIEMLETGLDIVTPVVMRVKIALGCPRPSQFSDRIQPMIPEPAHPTLPSGHSMQLFTMATMLSQLMEPGSQVVSDSQLYRLACRIAINRTVAGVHFPADSAAGAVLGIQLGRYLMARGEEDGGTVGSAIFDGGKFKEDDGQPRDFHYGRLGQMVAGDDASTSFSDDWTPVRQAPLWQSLCARARREWETRWS